MGYNVAGKLVRGTGLLKRIGNPVVRNMAADLAGDVLVTVPATAARSIREGKDAGEVLGDVGKDLAWNAFGTGIMGGYDWARRAKEEGKGFLEGFEEVLGGGKGRAVEEGGTKLDDVFVGSMKEQAGELSEDPFSSMNDVDMPGSRLYNGEVIEGDNIDKLFRKTKNVGLTKELEEVMQLKNVKKVAREAGVGLDGIKIKIDRNPELIGKKLYGYTDGGIITLYPDAFQNKEALIKTLGHERMHSYQFKLFGKPKSTEDLRQLEKAAFSSEQDWWNCFLQGGK